MSINDFAKLISLTIFYVLVHTISSRLVHTKIRFKLDSTTTTFKFSLNQPTLCKFEFT